MKKENKFALYTLVGTGVMYIGYLYGSLVPREFGNGLFWCFITTGLLCMLLDIGGKT
jgi:hypothetical protein